MLAVSTYFSKNDQELADGNFYRWDGDQFQAYYNEEWSCSLETIPTDYMKEYSEAQAYVIRSKGA